MRDDIAQQKEAEDDVREPKWLEDDTLLNAAAPWGMPCEFPCGAVKMLLYNNRALRAAVVRASHCTSWREYLVVRKTMLILLGRQTPPEVK